MHTEDAESQNVLGDTIKTLWASSVSFRFGSISFLAMNALWFISQHSLNLLVVFDFACIVLFLVFAAYLVRSGEGAERRALALKLGCAFSPTGDVRSLAAALASAGYSPSMTNVFSGTHNGHSLRIFDYCFFAQSQRRTSVGGTFYEIRFSHALPSIGIFGVDTGAYTSLALVSNRLCSGVPVRLEGGFEKSFSVLAQSGSEQEVRELLAPDVMALLLDTMQGSSVFLIENRLYICSKNQFAGEVPVFTSKDFTEMHGRVMTLVDKMLPTAERLTESGSDPTK